MRVVCDNCGATYKIPEHKLKKDVNKATCRKCGHRMLIRKASSGSGAGPGEPKLADERTLVTSAADIERKAREQAEAARASIEDSPGYKPAGPDAWGDDAPTQVQPPPVEHAPAPRSEPSPRAPAPLAPKAAAPRPVPSREHAPAPRRDAAPAAAAQAHDPSGELTWAMLGAFGAIAGVLLLAANFGDSSLVRFIGVFFAMGGALTSLFILVTGNRGRRAASVAISLALAFFFSVLGAGGVHLAHVGVAGLSNMGQGTLAAATSAAEARAEAKAAELAKTQAAADAKVAEEAKTAEEAKAAEEAAAAEEAKVAEEAKAAEEAAVAEAAAAKDPPKAAASSSGSSTKSSGSSSGSTARGSGTDLVAGSSTSSSRSSAPSSSGSTSSRSSSTTSSSSSRSSTPSSSSGSSGSSSSGSSARTEAPIPITVIDTMLRNNKDVKGCFVDYKAANGSFPSRVEVKLTIQNSGRVSTSRVVTSQYANTELDSCLGSAIRGITFPSFEGDAFSFKYPFVL